MAGFDVGEKSVLLGFVEAMDFVDEDDGSLAAVRFAFRGGHDFLDFLDAGEHRAEGYELGTREAGNHARERGFAATGRTPQEHRGDLIVFNLLAERFAGAEKFFLADEFIERARAHAFGERLVSGVFGGGLGEFGEEAHDLAPIFSDKELRWRAAS